MKTLDQSDIAAFYDEFGKRLLRDFVYGNLRVKMACDRVNSVITPHVNSILDVGCGIGTASATLVERHSHITVHGVDISPNNVAIAKTLLANPRLTFSVSDMTHTPEGGPYDIVTLIDVYEHIPLGARSPFHAALADSLSETGIVVLTFPSPLHQKWLAANQPSGLQIVDETIQTEDVLALANALDAELTFLEWVSVWSTNQYCHAILSRAPVYEAAKVEPANGKSLLTRGIGRIQRLASMEHHSWGSASEIESRRQRIREVLGIEIA